MTHIPSSEEKLQYLILLIKGRNDPFLMAASIGQCYPAGISRIIKDLTDRHSELTHEDFEYLGQSLTPGSYLEALRGISHSGHLWLGDGAFADLDDLEALGKIQAFLERAESWKGNNVTAGIDTSVIMHVDLLRIMTTLDQDPVVQAKKFSKIEQSLVHGVWGAQRDEHLQNLLGRAAYIDQGLPSDALSVRRWIHVMDAFQALPVESEFASLKAIELLCGYEKQHPALQPAIQERVRAMATQCVEQVIGLDQQGLSSFMTSLSQNRIQGLRSLLSSANQLPMAAETRKRLHETVFLAATNANPRRAKDGFSELIEAIKPEVDWPEMISKLNETGRNVMLELYGNRNEYLSLMPRADRGRAVSLDLGI